jgi:hypothetical protein
MDSLHTFYKIAQDNIPPNVSMCCVDPLESCGIASYATGKMTVRRPASIENLLTYLHECGHFVLHKDDEDRWCLWRPDHAGFDSRSIFEGALIEE